MEMGGIMNLFQKIWNFVEEKYLESKHPVWIEIFAALFVSLISYIVVLRNFIILLSENVSITYKILLVLLFLTLIIISTSLINRLRQFRHEILERNKLIEEIVKEVDPNYEVSEIVEVHEIKKNGDGFFKRTVWLKYIGDKVTWYEMSLGNTQGRNEQGKGNITVFSACDHKTKLSNLPFKNDGSKIHHAIILNPILSTENEISGLVITREWKQVWEQLLSTLDDKGKISFKYYTKNFKLQITLPNKYEFTNHKILPNIGVWSDTQIDQRNRQYIILSGENIPPGIYEYQISVRKMRK